MVQAKSEGSTFKEAVAAGLLDGERAMWRAQVPFLCPRCTALPLLQCCAN